MSDQTAEVPAQKEKTQPQQGELTLVSSDPDRQVRVDENGKRHITFVCELPSMLAEGQEIGG